MWNFERPSGCCIENRSEERPGNTIRGTAFLGRDDGISEGVTVE